MDHSTTIFSQIMSFLPIYEFNKCVNRYHGNRRIKTFSTLNQFYIMSFAQLTYRESLRDIEACLNAMHKKLYRIGIRGPVRRSTLADANERRDWRIYADFAQVLIKIARPLYADTISVSIWTIPFMLWIQQRSIYAYHCFHGLDSERTRLQ